MALADEKCVPCSGTTPKLSSEESAQLARQIPCWDLHGDHIERTFTFNNFVNAMSFANEITQIAESENHHPDLHISWGKVRVELTTHAISGLSTNDFVLAAKIDRIAERV